VGLFIDDIQDAEKRMSLDDCVPRAGVSIHTLRRWVKSGRLKAVKLGGKWITTGLALTGAMFNKWPTE